MNFSPVHLFLVLFIGRITASSSVANDRLLSRLNEAISEGNLHLVRMTLMECSFIEPQDPDISHPVAHAKEVGADISIIEELFSHPNLFKTENALSVAIKFGYYQFIGLLSQSYCKDIDRQVALDTFLAIAIRDGNDRLVTVLLENGSNVRYNKYTDDIFCWTIRTGNIEIVTILVNHLAQRYGSGNPVYLLAAGLDDAVKKENYEITKLLLEHGAKTFPLHRLQKLSEQVKSNTPLAIMLKDAESKEW